MDYHYCNKLSYLVLGFHMLMVTVQGRAIQTTQANENQVRIY